MSKNVKQIVIALSVACLIFVIALIFALKVSKDSGVKQREPGSDKKPPVTIRKIEHAKDEFVPNIDLKKTKHLMSQYSNSSILDYALFEQSLRSINNEILRCTADNLGLNNSEKKKVLRQYKKHHDEVSRNFYNQVDDLNKSECIAKDETFISYSTYQCAENFEKVVSANICNLAGYMLTFSALSPSRPVRILWGRPCEFILSTVLKPIANYIKKLAIVEDYTKSKISLENHIRNQLLELATAEDVIKTVWEQEYIRKLKFWFWDSKAKINSKVSARVKAGFNLKKYFGIEFDHTQNEIIIKLPEPEILSCEVEHEIVDIENGILIKIDKDKLNDVNRKVRDWVHKHAIESGILKKAKKDSQSVLKMLFQPIVMATDQPYKLRVKFQSGTTSDDKILLEVGRIENPNIKK